MTTVVDSNKLPLFVKFWWNLNELFPRKWSSKSEIAIDLKWDDVQLVAFSRVCRPQNSGGGRHFRLRGANQFARASESAGPPLRAEEHPLGAEGLLFFWLARFPPAVYFRGKTDFGEGKPICEGLWIGGAPFGSQGALFFWLARFPPAVY